MKSILFYIRLSLVTSVVFGSGCVGYNSAFTGTTSNVGLNIDTKTPTAEVSIARREVNIAPAFEGGYVPPIAASHRVKGAWIFAGVSSTFLGGDAAATMASEDANEVKDAGHDLTEIPIAKAWFRAAKPVVKKGEVRPFVFATDTTFGLKVGWSGLTAQFPDTLKLGFNRKEMALAPITATEGTQPNSKVRIKMPSYLATTSSNTRTGPSTNFNFTHTQYFATGAAANALSLRPEIREVMFERLDPAAADIQKQRQTAGPIANEIVQKLKSYDQNQLKQSILDAKKKGILPTTNNWDTQVATETEQIRQDLIDTIQDLADSGTSETTQTLKGFLSQLP